MFVYLYPLLKIFTPFIFGMLTLLLFGFVAVSALGHFQQENEDLF